MSIQASMEFVIQNRVSASTVKWIAPDPCLVLRENDSTLCTNFGFCKEKNYRHLKKHIDLQSRAIYDDKQIPRKVYMF